MEKVKVALGNLGPERWDKPRIDLKTPYCNTRQRIAIRVARVPARKVLRARGTG